MQIGNILIAFTLLSFQISAIELTCNLVGLTTDPGKTACTDILTNDTSMQCCWLTYEDGDTKKYDCTELEKKEESFNDFIKGYEAIYKNVDSSCSSSSIMLSILLLLSILYI